MNSLILLFALTALSNSLSIPNDLIGTSGPYTLHLPRSSNSTPVIPSWPPTPYRAPIASNIDLVINAANNYMPPASFELETYVLTNLSRLISAFKSEDPEGHVDNSQVFSFGHVTYPLSVQSTGLVSVRFPVVLAQGEVAVPRITNEVAVQVLEAIWLMEKRFGPRGLSFAMVEVDGIPWSYFSLWLSQLKPDP